MSQDGVTSDMPDNCPECGAPWHAVEGVHTGDDRALNGWEDWCFCLACGLQNFYPWRLIDAAAHP